VCKCCLLSPQFVSLTDEISGSIGSVVLSLVVFVTRISHNSVHFIKNIYNTKNVNVIVIEAAKK